MKYVTYYSLAKVYIFALMSVAGCAHLPSNGPNYHSIIADAEFTSEKTEEPEFSYNLIKITEEIVSSQPDNVTKNFSNHVKSTHTHQGLRLISAGDKLEMTFWETSDIRLLSDAGQRATNIDITVDRNGYIVAPFVGRIKSSGLSLDALRQNLIEAYERQSINPEVTLAISDSSVWGVSVLGDVSNSGRIPLPVQDVKLLDLLALAGGIDAPPWEVTVQLKREGHNETVGLSDILQSNHNNITVQYGDTVYVHHEPRVFSVFGAVSEQGAVAVNTQEVSLLELLSAAGGLEDTHSEPSAIFVYRDTGPQSSQPAIYQLDLRQPSSFFLGSRFRVQPNDVLYVGTADSTSIGRLFNIILAPISGIRSL